MNKPLLAVLGAASALAALTAVAAARKSVADDKLEAELTVLAWEQEGVVLHRDERERLRQRGFDRPLVVDRHGDGLGFAVLQFAPGVNGQHGLYMRTVL